MKKLLILLLAVLLLAFPLASCKPKPNDPEPSGGTDQTDQDPSQVNLPPMDFGNRTFTILVPGDFDFWLGGETTASRVSEALVKRYDFIEETYSINLESALVAYNADYTSLLNSYSAGLQSYDIMAPHPTWSIAALMTSGMLQDLEDVEYIDTSAPWWNQSQVKNFAVNGKLFMGVGDMSVNQRSIGVQLLNKTMYNAKYQRDIYDVVFSGEWTLEKMYELVMDNYDDEAAEPIYGYAMHQDLITNYYYSAGELLLRPNADGSLSTDFNTERLENLSQKLYRLVIGAQTLKTTWYNGTFLTGDAWTSFSSQRALLLDFDLGGFGYMLRDLPFQVAFLPYPKVDDTQKDYCLNAAGGFICIPNDAKDIDCSAFIFEAVNQHSYYNLRPEYIENYLGYVLSKDPNDYRSLDMCLTNMVYDLGYNLDKPGTTMGKAVSMLKTVIVDNLSTNISGYLAANEESIKKTYSDIVDEIY